MGYIQNGNSKIEIVSSSENESSTSNMTQYPVEQGAPIADNMIFMGGPTTISGFLIGDDAEQNYNTLVEWQKNAIQVSFRGRIYLKTAGIQSISKGYDRYKNGFSISITLQPIRIATAVWEKIPQPPVVKQPSPAAKPSTAVYVTVKRGNTYWGWWRQYGTPIQTLRNWNKWPDRFIPIGARARVK